MDEFVFNELPDDPCHLIAVEFDDWVRYLDFAHGILRIAWLNGEACLWATGIRVAL